MDRLQLILINKSIIMLLKFIFNIYAELNYDYINEYNININIFNLIFIYLFKKIKFT